MPRGMKVEELGEGGVAETTGMDGARRNGSGWGREGQETDKDEGQEKKKEEGQETDKEEGQEKDKEEGHEKDKEGGVGRRVPREPFLTIDLKVLATRLGIVIACGRVHHVRLWAVARALAPAHLFEHAAG